MIDLSDRLVANLFFLFRELAHQDRFAAAAGAGFSWVEDPAPYDLSADHYAAAAAAAGVQVASLNTPAGDETRGDFGLAAVPGRQDDFRAGFERAVEYATACDAPMIHAMVGVVGEDEGDPRGTLIDNLGWAAGRAAEIGRRVIIETINVHDRPGWYVSTTPHAVQIIEAVGADNLGILFDIYHLYRMGEDVRGQLAAVAPHIFHVQVASLPDRHEPVGGDLPLDELVRALEAAGYDGLIAAEYTPATTTAAGIDWVAAYRGQPA